MQHEQQRPAPRGILVAVVAGVVAIVAAFGLQFGLNQADAASSPAMVPVQQTQTTPEDPPADGRGGPDGRDCPKDGDGSSLEL